MTIFEPTVTKEILKITCDILHKYFYYDESDLDWFLDTFTVDFGQELDDFEALGDPMILDELHRDCQKRLHFTCYFVSASLRDIFINKMHFSEQELEAFDSILPKYTGENYDKRPKHKRTHYRKFFK